MPPAAAYSVEKLSMLQCKKETPRQPVKLSDLGGLAQSCQCANLPLGSLGNRLHRCPRALPNKIYSPTPNKSTRQPSQAKRQTLEYGASRELRQLNRFHTTLSPKPLSLAELANHGHASQPDRYHVYRGGIYVSPYRQTTSSTPLIVAVVAWNCFFPISENTR